MPRYTKAQMAREAKKWAKVGRARPRKVYSQSNPYTGPRSPLQRAYARLMSSVMRLAWRGYKGTGRRPLGSVISEAWATKLQTRKNPGTMQRFKTYKTPRRTGQRVSKGRKTRKDKGTKRGPRKVKTASYDPNNTTILYEEDYPYIS